MISSTYTDMNYKSINSHKTSITKEKRILYLYSLIMVKIVKAWVMRW